MTRALFIAAVLSVSACVEPSLPSDAAVADAGPYRCSPLTCTGCCAGDTCLGGNLDTACGYDGRQCRACPTQTACQSPGACISVPQDAGVDPFEVTQLDRPIDPYSGNPLVDPPRNRCVWVFGFPVCN